MIIRSGFNVYPAEIEAVLNEHPAVLHSAVVGRAVPDNEEVVAFVEMAPGKTATPAEIARFAAARLVAVQAAGRDRDPAGAAGVRHRQDPEGGAAHAGAVAPAIGAAITGARARVIRSYHRGGGTMQFRTIVRASLWLIGSFLTIAAGSIRAEEFLVGVETPLSGSLARVGTGMSEGISVATDVFNRKNGKHRIRLITIDDESSPAKAVAAVEKLASQNVVAITGGYGSNNIGPASDAANKAGLVYITSGGVDEALTQRGFKTFFRINNTAGYSKAMLGLLAEMGAKSVSIVYLTKEATSDLARDVEKALVAKGVKVTMHAFDPAITDFKPIVNKIKLQDKPDVIAMSGYENDYVGILRAAKVLKPDVKAMVGVWSLATSKMADDFPDLMPNVYGTALLPFPAEFTSPDGQDFAETYKKLYGHEPDYLAQFGYVQSQLLFDAIVRAFDAGTLKTGGIAAELRKSNKETLIGKVSFDDKGDNPNFAHRMGQHQGKKIVVVWPKEYANGKMAFPGVPW